MVIYRSPIVNVNLKILPKPKFSHFCRQRTTDPHLHSLFRYPLRMATVEGGKWNLRKQRKQKITWDYLLRATRPSMTPYDHCATRFRVSLHRPRGEEREAK